MIIAVYIFALAAIVQMAYYLLVFSHLFRVNQKLPNNLTFVDGVSVIICAHNEQANLLKYLPTVLTQNHPNYEVIVVNDHSMDGTASTLLQLSQQYPHLKVVHLLGEKTSLGKREALLTGAKAAKNDYLLLTDADCQPESNDWIALMTSPLSASEKQLVLGYGAYETSNGLLNQLIQYETFFTALQYFSLAIIGHPYMGVGRNIAYKKDFFLANNHFDKYHNLLGGDDDLLVNGIANATNTAICLINGSATISKPQTTWQKWLYQKTRHASAGLHYNVQSKIISGIFLTTMIACNIGAIILLLKFDENHVIISLMLLKTIFQVVIYHLLMYKFRIKLPWVLIPILDFCLSGFLISFGVLSLRKHQAWKK